jgi:hypothetical protein
MISKITSRAACLAELTSNPKSFFNCPDMHGGSGLAGGRFRSGEIHLLDPAGNLEETITFSEADGKRAAGADLNANHLAIQRLTDVEALSC